MKNTPPSHPNRGFTLVELTIVLVIVALLIGGLLVPLSAQRDMRNINETQQQLKEIKEALLGFAAIWGRLPCPANPMIASGATGAGIEYASTATGCTTSVEGVLPWATLGLPETDAWGRRFTYRVRSVFAQTPPAFSLSSTGDITVYASSGGTKLADTIPVIVIAHGKNGLGAYLQTGSRMQSSADADELENLDADTEFVSKPSEPAFDDLVTWIAPGVLMNRMISAGKLP